MKRWLSGFFAGILTASTVVTVWALTETKSSEPAQEGKPRYVLVTVFHPEPAWTPGSAKGGIEKLKADYDAKKPKGFLGKTFFGDFKKNEFGGIYLFATKEDAEALVKAYPRPNRDERIYEVLGMWSPKKPKSEESAVGSKQ